MRGSRVILVGKTPYRNTLYAFDPVDGKISSEKLLDYPGERAFEALYAVSPDLLIGITSKQELVEIQPSTGAVRAVSKVRFDSGYRHPGSFTVSRDGRRAFVMSKTHCAPDLSKTVFGNALYEFDLSDGSALSTRPVEEVSSAGFEAPTRMPRAMDYARGERLYHPPLD